MSEQNKVINSEILIDTGNVCVSMERYNELVSAEAKLKIVESMYNSTTSSYNYEEFLRFIFGAKGENEYAE